MFFMRLSHKQIFNGDAHYIQTLYTYAFDYTAPKTRTISSHNMAVPVSLLRNLLSCKLSFIFKVAKLEIALAIWSQTLDVRVIQFNFTYIYVHACMYSTHTHTIW